MAPLRGHKGRALGSVLPSRHHHAVVAQFMVERLIENQKVVGSNPTGRTRVEWGHLFSPNGPIMGRMSLSDGVRSRR